MVALASTNIRANLNRYSNGFYLRPSKIIWETCYHGDSGSTIQVCTLLALGVPTQGF